MATKKSPEKSNVSKDDLIAHYKEMLLIRRFEEKAGQLYGMGLIGGFCHLYIGQEAVVVGLGGQRQGRRQAVDQLPRPWPHARLRDGPQGRDGRTDRAVGRLFRAARAARCTCSAATSISTAVTGSSARRCQSGPGWRWPTSIKGNDSTSPSPISAMGRRTRARSTRPTTWRSCGTCR